MSSEGNFVAASCPSELFQERGPEASVETVDKLFELMRKPFGGKPPFFSVSFHRPGVPEALQDIRITAIQPLTVSRPGLRLRRAIAPTTLMSHRSELEQGPRILTEAVAQQAAEYMAFRRTEAEQLGGQAGRLAVHALLIELKI